MIDCINEILDFHRHEPDLNSETAKKWLSSALIRLMSDFRDDDNHLRIRNCLILLINLFFGHDEDYIHQSGKSTCNLSENEKHVLLDVLMTELETQDPVP